MSYGVKSSQVEGKREIKLTALVAFEKGSQRGWGKETDSEKRGEELSERKETLFNTYLIKEL